MARAMVTSCANLDIRRFAREGWLRPQTRFEWTWRNKDGHIKSAIRVVVLENIVVLSYVLRPWQEARRVSDRIPLTWSVVHPGGKRPWFTCPGCQRRCAKLYLVGEVFRCRGCHGLVYPSQYPCRERAGGRRHRRLS